MFITERIKINADIKQAKALIKNLSPSEIATSQAARTALTKTQQAIAKLDAYYAKHRFLGRLVKWIDQTFGAYKTLLCFQTSLVATSPSAKPNQLVAPSQAQANFNKKVIDPKNMPRFKKAADPEMVKNATIPPRWDIRGNSWNDHLPIQAAVRHALMSQKIEKNWKVVSQVWNNKTNLKDSVDFAINNFSNFRKLVIDLSFEEHNSLIIIDKDLRTVEFYDPKISYGAHNIRQQYLNMLATKMNETDPGNTPYCVIEKINKYLAINLKQ